MGTINVERYKQIEKLIREAGIDELKIYLHKNGHRLNNFERNINIIKYCMQHGPLAASKVYHVAVGYPTKLSQMYGQAAEEIIRERKRKNMDNPICPVCRGD